jgi:hypothetical protein
MPEINLAIGKLEGEIGGIKREWLSWFDDLAHPYPLPTQLLQQERQRISQLEQALEQERSEKLHLIEKLRDLGVDITDMLP